MLPTVSKPPIPKKGVKIYRLLSSGNGSAAIMLAVISVSTFLSLSQFVPPPAAPPNIAPESFSSGRAMEHLGRIALRPHPVGSPEHEAVFNYLISALTSMNLTPEIQEATVVRERRNFSRVGGAIRNVMVRLPGTDNSRPLLFTSHYDSAPTGVGASDDGAAVAAMLECLRALRAG